MGLYEGQGQLSKSMKDLLGLWAETRRSWDDIRATEFEKQHLAPLEQDVRNAVAAMGHIASILTQVRRDCE